VSSVPQSRPEGDRMEPVNNLLIKETVLAYRHYWTALLESAEPIWSELELTILQLKGLVLLEVRGELPVSGIASALDIARPSASVLVGQLVQMGIAMRAEDDKDRRRSLVYLTQEGKELIARLHRGDEHFMEQLFARLNPDDLIALRRGLHALTEAICAAKA